MMATARNELDRLLSGEVLPEKIGNYFFAILALITRSSVPGAIVARSKRVIPS